MQINKLSKSQNFGTKCYIGETSAELSLKRYGKNLSKGIMDAFNKLSKNDNTDILSISMGTPIDKNFGVVNFSYFSGEGAYQSSLTVKINKLAKNSKRKITKLIQEYYSKLKKSNEKSNIVPFFFKKSDSLISNSHESLIKKLCNKYGSDDSSLFSA